MKREINYQTTDLELIAQFDLTPLAHALTNLGFVLYHVGQGKNGLWSARFTTADGFPEPDQGITTMLTAIELLDEPSQRLWTTCTSRDFNIGYECGDEPWGFIQQLSVATLARIAAANTGLVITIYPTEPHPGSSPEEEQKLVPDLSNKQPSIKQFYPGQLIGLVIGFTIGVLQEGINTALPLSALGYFIAKALLVSSDADRIRQVLYGVVAFIIVFIGVGLAYQNRIAFLIYTLLAVTFLKKLSN